MPVDQQSFTQIPDTMIIIYEEFSNFQRKKTTWFGTLSSKVLDLVLYYSFFLAEDCCGGSMKHRIPNPVVFLVWKYFSNIMHVYVYIHYIWTCRLIKTKCPTMKDRQIQRQKSTKERFLQI